MRLAAFYARVFSVLMLGCSSSNPLEAPTDGGSSSGGGTASGGGSVTTSSSSSSGGASSGVIIQPAGPAVLVLTPTNGLSFGTVFVGNTSTGTINVSNTGGKVATALSDASANLGDFSYAGGSYPGTGGTCQGTLEPASGCKLLVVLAPTSITSESATLTLSYDDSVITQKVSIALSGSAQPIPLGGTGQVVDSLGTVATDGPNTVSKVLTATKHPEDDAIAIILLSQASDQVMLVDPITDPNGIVIENRGDPEFFDPGDYWYFWLEQNRSETQTSAQTVVIPQSPAYAAPAGDYQFQINANANINVDVYVVHQLAQTPITTPSTPAASHVNVNFYFTGGAETAAGAQTDVGFQLVVKQFVALFGQKAGACNGTPPAGSLGLCIDSINYFDIDPKFAHINGDFTEGDPPDPDVIELFSQSAGHPVGMNFFFISDVSLGGIGDGFKLLGLDGAIPAPGAFMGTNRSGCLVVLDAVPAPADPSYIPEAGTLAATIAHEGGHYLGLFHNQEGSCQPDNLADTPCDPACVCQNPGGGSCTQYLPVDPPGNMNFYSCPNLQPGDMCCPDAADSAKNTMYWLSSGSLTTFTADQAITTHRHPLVH